MQLLFGIFTALVGVSFHGPNPSNVIATQLVSNSISGYVSDNQRTPIPDLQVELLNDVDSVIQRTKTDSSGLFVFRRLTTGVFQVRVQTYGTNYIGQTQRVQISRLAGVDQVNFNLSTKGTVSTTAMAGAIFVQEVPEQARKLYEQGSALLQKPSSERKALRH